MVKSLGSPTANPAALEAVKPEAAASRYTYIKHNMNWTRSVLGAKNMPVYEKAARVAAAFFVALVEFFLVNGAFLFANAGIFIANQAHRAFAKQQISEIELPPSPKSPKGPFTPTVAQLSDTTPSDGQPSPAANRSPRAEDLAAAVNAAAADVLPQPEQRQDILPPADAQPEQRPEAQAAANAALVPAVQEDAASVHSEQQPAAVQDEVESVASAEEDLLQEAIAASLLPPTPTASENAAAIGLFADLEEATDEALLEATLAASQQQQDAPVDAETVHAALNGFVEDLDDAMLNQGLAASQLPGSPSSKASSRSQSPAAEAVADEWVVVTAPSSKASSRAQSPAAAERVMTPVAVQQKERTPAASPLATQQAERVLSPVFTFVAPANLAAEESEVSGDELASSKASSRAQSPVAAEELPAAVRTPTPKIASRVTTPLATLVVEEQPAAVVASPSSKASSRAQSPVAAEEMPAAVRAPTPKAASRVTTPVATLVVEEQPAAVQASPSSKASSRVPSPVAVQQKERTPAASPVPTQQAERVSTPVLPFVAPAAVDLPAEESDDSGDELASSPRVVYGDENLLSPERGASPAQFVYGDENLLTPSPSNPGSPRAESPAKEEAPGVSQSQKGSPRSATPASEAADESDEVSSQDGSGDEYESDSDDAGSNLNSPAVSPKPAGMARLWGLFGK